MILAIYLIVTGLIFVGLCLFLIWQKDCEPEAFIGSLGVAAVWPAFALWYAVRAVKWLWVWARKGAK